MGSAIFMSIMMTVAFFMGFVVKDANVEHEFEELTGINWYSFNAAHDDCEAHWKERCKIYGGFVPESALRDEK